MFIVIKFNAITPVSIACGWTGYQSDLAPNFGTNIWNWQLEPGSSTSFHWADGSSNTNWNYFSLKRPNSGTSATAKVNAGGTWSRNTYGGTGPITALKTGKLWLGTRNDLAAPLNGQIGEVLLYSNLMSDTDIATVNAYLAAKWAI
jgi:hypothetical protein